MLTSNEMDPERAKLCKVLLDLMERNEEIHNLLHASTNEVSNLVSSAIQTGEIKVDKYKTAKESWELYKDISAGLKILLDEAQLDLWNYDLHKAESDFNLAKEKVLECRDETLNIMIDKTNYIRSANADKTINPVERADRISAFEVLLIDARNRSRQAEQRRDQMKTKLERIKREYNEFAVELGGESQKLMTLETFMGHG